MIQQVLLTAIVCFFIQFIYAQSYTSYRIGNTTEFQAAPSGGICLMGGATEQDNAMQWFLEQANGGDILVLRTSGSDGYNTYLYTDLGITVNSVETIVCHNASCADEAYIQQRIMEADAIWFAGGDQWTYVEYWRGTAIDSLINIGLQDRNIVIGGTSAGMAIQGQAYFSAENGSVTSATALANPYNNLMAVDTTHFLQNDWLQEVITDTHYDNPDRKGRHTTFLARLEQWGWNAKGIACDEYTAVCIDTNGIAHVYGDYPNYEDNAYFIRTNCLLADPSPEQCSSGQPLTWNHNGQALMVYQVKGTTSGANTFDLNDWQTGSGGTWNYWSAINGTFVETPTTQPDCSLASLDDWSGANHLFPNPVKTELQVQLAPAMNFEGIYSLSGNRLSVQLMDNKLNVSHLAPGIYEVRFLKNAVMYRQKIVKQ